MRAIVAHEPGKPDVLVIEERPIPEPADGWVLIRIGAFGLNRAEMFTRQGHSPGTAFPRVLGIECVGEVEAGPGTELVKGQLVAAMMGGMGREFDGSYAEYVCVPRRCVHPLVSDLPWSTLGALPEMFQTTFGSLHTALECRTGDKLLVRGGTSSIGRAAIRMAKRLGLEVAATTRNPSKGDALKKSGADHVILDDGTIAERVRTSLSGGADKVLELVGTTTLRDSLTATRRGGVVCMTGILGGAWSIENFEPMTFIPTGVRLTSYSGDADDISTEQLQAFVDDVAQKRVRVDVDRVFRFDEIGDAHRYMEASRARGKLVVRVRKGTGGGGLGDSLSD